MNNFIAFIDESGNKYKASTKPNKSDEFGLAVGLIFHQQHYDKYQLEFNERYKIPDGKAHVTDWNPNDQNTAREIVFQLVRKYSGIIVYSAINSHGYHKAEYIRMNQAFEESKKSARNTLKVSQNKENPFAHSELISNVILKARAYVSDLCVDNGIDVDQTAMDIKIDNVDPVILAEAQDNVKRLEHLGNGSETPVTAYDPNSKNVIKKTIKTELTGLPDLNLPKFSINIEEKGNIGILLPIHYTNTSANFKKQIMKIRD